MENETKGIIASILGCAVLVYGICFSFTPYFQNNFGSNWLAFPTLVLLVGLLSLSLVFYGAQLLVGKN